MNIFLSILFLFAFSGNFSNAEKSISPEGATISDDPKVVVEGLRDFYKRNAYVYHELSYLLFQDQTATAPYSTENGLFIKQGDAQYSRLSSLESLTTEAYTISVDNEEKTVMISNHIALPPTGAMVSIDNWINPKSKLSIKNVSEQRSALSIEMPEGEVQEAIIIYEKATFQPVKIVLNYRRSIQLTAEEDSPLVQPRLEIVYTRTALEELEKERVVMSAYVYGSKEHWRLASKYSGYDLINNIHEIADGH